MHAFRDAVERGDFDALGDLLAQDVVFRSPVAFRPYEGRPLVTAILRGVGRVFEDFHYVDELAAEQRHALVFQTRVGDVSLHGCDFITVDDDGLISELTVMVRPLSAAHALAEAMGAQFPQIQTEAMESR
ncbi:nuclear transport factor 2 family protein [Aeromicrobium sp. CF4.19]|uniref:nuclear transport factor 2 family protein n=1 Tax=Aeromicrobium sp. CF4.19 TaxID=3373082 RepID=UPI003EE68447